MNLLAIPVDIIRVFGYWLHDETFYLALCCKQLLAIFPQYRGNLNGHFANMLIWQSIRNKSMKQVKWIYRTYGRTYYDINIKNNRNDIYHAIDHNNLAYIQWIYMINQTDLSNKHKYFNHAVKLSKIQIMNWYYSQIKIYIQIDDILNESHEVILWLLNNYEERNMIAYAVGHRWPIEKIKKYEKYLDMNILAITIVDFGRIELIKYFDNQTAIKAFQSRMLTKEYNQEFVDLCLNSQWCNLLIMSRYAMNNKKIDVLKRIYELSPDIFDWTVIWSGKDIHILKWLNCKGYTMPRVFNVVLFDRIIATYIRQNFPGCDIFEM
jgi:hypothetical protein